MTITDVLARFREVKTAQHFEYLLFKNPEHECLVASCFDELVAVVEAASDVVNLAVNWPTMERLQKSLAALVDKMGGGGMNFLNWFIRHWLELCVVLLIGSCTVKTVYCDWHNCDKKVGLP